MRCVLYIKNKLGLDAWYSIFQNRSLNLLDGEGKTSWFKIFSRYWKGPDHGDCVSFRFLYLMKNCSIWVYALPWSAICAVGDRDHFWFSSKTCVATNMCDSLRILCRSLVLLKRDTALLSKYCAAYCFNVIPEALLWDLFLVSCVQTWKKCGSQLSLNLATCDRGLLYAWWWWIDWLVCKSELYFWDAERISEG